MLRLEHQILLGDGQGENLTGLANTAGIQVQAFSNSVLETARKALSKLHKVEIPGGVFVLGVDVWEALELLTVGDDEHYALGSASARLPVDRAEQRLWGQPVIVTSVLTDPVGYLADFAGSTMLWEREAVRIDWSENVYDPGQFGVGDGGSDFEANRIRFRAEGDFGFGVTRPLGVVEFQTEVSAG